MSPLTGTRVVHPRFSALHRPIVRSLMTAQVRIDRRTPGQDDDAAGWSPTAGKTVPAADAGLWSGPARVQAQASGVLRPEVAGQDVTTRDYLVQIPLDAPALSVDDGGDTITVLTCPDDPALVGRRLRVADIPFGTLVWSRDVIAVDDLSQNGPRA